MSDDVARAASVPVLRIADVVRAEVSARGIRRVGLLGTRFTMSSPSTGTSSPTTAST